MRWKKREKKIYKTGKPFLSFLPTKCHWCDYTFWLEEGYFINTERLIPSKCFRCFDCQGRLEELEREKVCNGHYTIEFIDL